MVKLNCRLLVLLCWFVALVFVAGCGGGTSDSAGQKPSDPPPTGTTVTLTAIEVTPASATIVRGATKQLTATALLADNTTKDVTEQVVWSSSDAGVVTVGNSAGAYGLASAVGAGTATITATLGGLSASTNLAVTSADLVAIDVTPALPSVPVGFNQQFTATATFSDDSHSDITAMVTWSSSNSAGATISNGSGNSGVATSAAPGTTTITATWGGAAGSTELTVNAAQLVSIDVDPSEQVTPLGLVQQFTASGNYDDGSTQDLTGLVTWSSSSTGVATVSNSGLATPAAEGVTTITASYGDIAGSTTLTVTSATLTRIEVSPGSAQISRGTTTPFTATGTYSDGTTQDLTLAVTWSSSASAVATVSNIGTTKGLATGVDAGTATVDAQLGAVSGSATLTVTAATLKSISIDPANVTLYLGVPEQFTATGHFSDGTTQDLSMLVTWKTSNRDVAVVSNAANSIGLVTPLRGGSITISAYFMGVGGSTNLTVSTASLESIAITPADQTLNARKTLRLTATGTFSDGHTADVTSTVTWRSSNKMIATVTNNPKKRRGTVKALRPGTVTITALMGSVKGTTTLTVK